MVHGHEQDGFVVGELYQHATDQWAAFQHERRLRLLGQQPLQYRLALGHIAQIVSDQPEAAVLGRDLLQRLPVDQHKGRAQRRMTSYDTIQGALQRLGVQRPTQTQTAADVIGLTNTLELREEPKPLLRERQHARCIRLQWQDRRQDCSGRRCNTRGKLLERRMLKQLRHADLGTQLMTQARGDPHRQQGMSPKCKEVVVPTDRLQTEQVAPDRGNGLFDGTLRCFICTRRIGRCIRCW